MIADRTEPFGAGDILVLYTDGITEAPNEDEKEFSGGRLADVVRARTRAAGARDQRRDPGERAALHRATSPQRDDLTLVTVKRL